MTRESRKAHKAHKAQTHKAQTHKAQTPNKTLDKHISFCHKLSIKRVTNHQPLTADKEQHTMTDTNTDTNTAAQEGHNNPPLTNDQVQAIAQTVGEKLASAMQYGDRAEKAKDGAISLREEAAQELYPELDKILGVTRESRNTFDAKQAKVDFPDYERVRIAICEAMSTRLKDPITLPKTLNYNNPKPPVFTSRVSKAFSRLVTSYKEGGDGGQSNADKDAREAEKMRKAAHRDMAEALRDIIKAYASNDADSVNVQVKASVMRWPTKNHDALFPTKKAA